MEAPSAQAQGILDICHQQVHGVTIHILWRIGGAISPLSPQPPRDGS